MCPTRIKDGVRHVGAGHCSLRRESLLHSKRAPPRHRTDIVLWRSAARQSSEKGTTHAEPRSDPFHVDQRTSDHESGLVGWESALSSPVHSSSLDLWSDLWFDLCRRLSTPSYPCSKK